RFVRGLVDEDLRDLAERPRVVAAGAAPFHPELLDELSVLRELQHLSIVGAVAADPNVALVVDGDAVVRLGPLEALAGAAPMADEVACGVELEHGRRRDAALA